MQTPLKRIVLAAAAAAALALAPAAGVVAHEPVYQDDLAEVQARIDALESARGSQGNSIDNLYELVDELRARLDTGAVSWDQNAEVDDIYAILDRIAASMRRDEDQPKE